MVLLPQAGNDLVTKSLTLKVRNADILPIPERPGHTIKLIISSDCPAGVTVGTPDFDLATAGQQDTVLVAGGRTKAAVVPLSFSRRQLTMYNREAPFRCTLTARVVTIGSLTNTDPSPSNDSATIELNIVDESDREQSAPDAQSPVARSLHRIGEGRRAGRPGSGSEQQHHQAGH